METLSFTCLSWSLPTFTAEAAVDGVPAAEDVLAAGPSLELARISERERAPVSQKLLPAASVVRVGRVDRMMVSMSAWGFGPTQSLGASKPNGKWNVPAEVDAENTLICWPHLARMRRVATAGMPSVVQVQMQEQEQEQEL